MATDTPSWWAIIISSHVWSNSVPVIADMVSICSADIIPSIDDMS